MADLYTKIQNKLDEENSIYIQDAENFVSYRLKDAYWEIVSGTQFKGEAEHGFTHSNLKSFLCKMPHESKIKGSCLIVTGINLSTQI